MENVLWGYCILAWIFGLVLTMNDGFCDEYLLFAAIFMPVCIPTVGACIVVRILWDRREEIKDFLMNLPDGTTAKVILATRFLWGKPT